MHQEIGLGLRRNWKQFTLLVIVNAFVGGMVGLERSILPELAETRFGLEAKTAIFSFIIIFGISKAVTNYFTGAFADRFGRRRLLIAGWLIALPIPFPVDQCGFLGVGGFRQSAAGDQPGSDLVQHGGYEDRPCGTEGPWFGNGAQ